jgi:hypothetical protein
MLDWVKKHPYMGMPDYLLLFARARSGDGTRARATMLACDCRRGGNQVVCLDLQRDVPAELRNAVEELFERIEHGKIPRGARRGDRRGHASSRIEIPPCVALHRAIESKLAVEGIQASDIAKVTSGRLKTENQELLTITMHNGKEYDMTISVQMVKKADGPKKSRKLTDEEILKAINTPPADTGVEWDDPDKSP